MTDPSLTEFLNLAEPPALRKTLEDALNKVVMLEPFDLINNLYEKVGIRVATESLLKTNEVATLLDLAKDEYVQRLIGSRLLYESKLARKYPSYTKSSPFEYSISSYVAVLLKVNRNWGSFVSACLMLTNGLNLPHKILNELACIPSR
jgi:hypothetical protein